MYRQKTCPSCQKEFMPKRLNQRFCGIKCRTFHNNEKARAKISETKSLDKRLHENRIVLKKIYDKYKGAKISHDFLLGAGFDFGLFTTVVASDSIRYMVCFEYGIGEIAKNQYIINNFNRSKL